MSNNNTQKLKCYICRRTSNDPSIDIMICIDPKEYVDRRWACQKCVNEINTLFQDLLSIYNPHYHATILCKVLPKEVFPIREEAINTIRAKHISSKCK